MIKRILETTIQERLWHGKAIILFGARQVGKTTMLKKCSKVVMTFCG